MSNVSKTIGYVLIAAASIAVVGWMILSFKAADLVGSPFLWAATPMALYIGLYLVARIPKGEIPQSVQKQIRRGLILKFLAFSFAVGLFFLLVHMVTQRHPLPSARIYTPISALVAIFSYVPFYLYWVRRAGSAGRSAVIVPLLFFLGIILSPMLFIEAYNVYHDDVETLPSGRDVLGASSNFIRIRNLELKHDYRLEWTEHSLKHQKFDEDDHEVQFYGLVPVDTERPDTLFTVWIQFGDWDVFDGEQGDATLRQQESDFLEACRTRLATLSVDTAVFFVSSTKNKYTVLRSNKYPLAEESIVLKPVYESLQEYRGGEILGYVGMYAVVVLMFWGGSVLNDD